MFVPRGRPFARREGLLGILSRKLRRGRVSLWISLRPGLSEASAQLHTYRDGKADGNRLPWLWRQRSPPICHLQAGDPGKLVVWFSLSLKAGEPGEPMVEVPVQGQKKVRWDVSAQVERQEKKWMPPCSSSWSVPALNGLDRAHACREGRPRLLSAPSHLLISAGSSFTDTPRNNV